MAPDPGDRVLDGPLPRSAATRAFGALLPLLLAEGLALAVLVGSGNMPPLVLRVFSALLTF
jgi:hypothetical protein